MSGLPEQFSQLGVSGNGAATGYPAPHAQNNGAYPPAYPAPNNGNPFAAYGQAPPHAPPAAYPSPNAYQQAYGAPPLSAAAPYPGPAPYGTAATPYPGPPPQGGVTPYPGPQHMPPAAGGAYPSVPPPVGGYSQAGQQPPGSYPSYHSANSGMYPAPPTAPAAAAPPAGPQYPSVESLGSKSSSAAAAAAAAIAAAGPAAAAAVAGTPAPAGWTLPANDHMPPPPTFTLLGPFLRFTSFDPVAARTMVSALVVTAPSVQPPHGAGPGAPAVQLHYGIDAPASRQAPCQLLDSFDGFKFWRFDLDLLLSQRPSAVTYTVGLVGASSPHCTHTLHLPARGQPWRWMFYSCNGFHEPEVEHKYGGIGALWRDVLQQHAVSPFHLQVGGGDQLYNDGVLSVPALAPWLGVTDPKQRAQMDMPPALQREAELYYFGNYCRHWGEREFGAAMATIPYLFSWDDHDIFDGWGSYDADLHLSKVFQGLFDVARRFYLLFQHHATTATARSAAATLGARSFSLVRAVGPDVVLMVPDTRSERTVHEVVPAANWDELFGEVERRLAASGGAVRHLAVVLTVPIVYPKIPLSESFLGGLSSALSSSHALRNKVVAYGGSLPSGVMNQFNEPDLLDDLRDHWTAADHAQERAALVRRLQGLCTRYGVRVTFLSGDVHLAAFGCFQGHPKVANRAEDPRFMLQVVSSAIGNEPPPGGVISLMESTNCAQTALGDTLDKMIRTFQGGKRLKGARNWCEINTVLEPSLDPATGVLLPPGSLAFTLRVEATPPQPPAAVAPPAGAAGSHSSARPPSLTGPPGSAVFASGGSASGGPPAPPPPAPLVECYTQAAPPLMPGAGAHGYGVAPPAHAAAQYRWACPGGSRAGCQPVHTGSSGVVGTVAGLLPKDTGAALQANTKKLGHMLGNFLGRV